MKPHSLLLFVLVVNVIFSSSCNRDDGRFGDRFTGSQDSQEAPVTEPVTAMPTQTSQSLADIPSPTSLAEDVPEPTDPAGNPVATPTPNPIEPLLDELDAILVEIDGVLGSEAAWQIDPP